MSGPENSENLRARTEITSHSGARVGGQIMNRFLFAKPPRIAPLRAAARRPAGFVASSSRTAPGTHRRSRLASGPGGLQQNANLFLREPLAENSQGGIVAAQERADIFASHPFVQHRRVNAPEISGHLEIAAFVQMPRLRPGSPRRSIICRQASSPTPFLRMLTCAGVSASRRSRCVDLIIAAHSGQGNLAELLWRVKSKKC